MLSQLPFLHSYTSEKLSQKFEGLLAGFKEDLL
jgi:hypothetical protein